MTIKELAASDLSKTALYGSAAMPAWLVEQSGIAPHIPVISKSNREDGILVRSDFHWDAKNDRHMCL